MEFMHRKESESTIESSLFEYQSRIATLEAEITSLQYQHANQLKFINALGQINKQITKATDVDGLLDSVLSDFLTIFSCDRAWLLAPCDPQAKFYRVHSQANRGSWPGADSNVKIPVDAPTANMFAMAIKAPGVLRSDPQVNSHLSSQEINKRFNVQSLMMIKIQPNMDKTWLIGIHHCEQSVVFNQTDIELFKTLSERISDGLANLLNLRRTQTLFENSEVSIWNEDLSEVYRTLNAVRQNGVKDLAKYIKENPQFVWDMVKLTKIIEVNRSSLQLFGAKTKKQLMGSIANTFTENSVEIFSDGLCAIFDGKKVFKKEVDFQATDGHILNTIITFQIPDAEEGFFCVPVNIIDITYIKQAEKEIEESAGRIRLLLDSTAEAIYKTDINGNCTLVNKACLNMLGYSSESELLGNNICKLIHQCAALNETNCQERSCAFYQPISQRIAVHLEQKILWRKDGSSFPATCWSNPIIEESEVVGVVVTFLDISEQLKDKATIKENHIKLQSTIEATISAISRAIEARDPYTAGHQKSVADLSRAIALEMGLSDVQVKGIYLGASIHDIGKIQVPAEMLCKPSRLTALEYQFIQTHSQAGYEIIKDVDFPWPIANILHQHHERMDGTGYPLGLKGDQICLEARIVAVADVVEAMHSHRPYRPGLGIDKALDEIQVNRGNSYDKNVVDACLRVFNLNKFKFETH